MSTATATLQDATVTAENYTSKISKLLLKAERTDNEHERNTCMERAAAIAARRGVSLELARLTATQGTRTPKLEQRVIRTGPRGKKGLYTFVTLYDAIASQNNVKITITKDSTTIFAYGFDTDIDMTQALYDSLLIQMVKASTTYLKTGAYRQDTTWSDTRYDYVPVHGSTARLSFQQGFAAEIRSRLKEARLRTEAQLQAREQQAREHFTAEQQEDDVQDDLLQAAPSEAVALVLREHAAKASDYYRQQTSHIRGSYKGGSSNSYSRSSSTAGRSAGARASISGTTSVGGSRAQVSA